MPFTVHIACTVHQTVISIEHLVIASAGFFRFAIHRKKLLHMVKLKRSRYNCIVFEDFQLTKLYRFQNGRPRFILNFLKILQISALILL